MKNTFYSVLFMSVVLPTFAAEMDIGYKDIPMGATITSVAERYPELTCRRTTGGSLGDIECDFSQINRCLNPSIPIEPYADKNACMTAVSKASLYDGKVTKTAMRFIGEKLGRIEVTTATYNFLDLNEALVKKYGAPSRTEESVVKNKLGASFVNVQSYWERDDVELRFSKFGSSLNEAFLTITTGTYTKEIDRRRKSRIEAGAANL